MSCGRNPLSKDRPAAPGCSFLFPENVSRVAQNKTYFSRSKPVGLIKVISFLDAVVRLHQLIVEAFVCIYGSKAFIIDKNM